MWSSVVAGCAFGMAFVSYFVLLHYVRKTWRLQRDLQCLYDIIRDFMFDHKGG